MFLIDISLWSVTFWTVIIMGVETTRFHHDFPKNFSDRKTNNCALNWQSLNN